MTTKADTAGLSIAERRATSEKLSSSDFDIKYYPFLRWEQMMAPLNEGFTDPWAFGDHLDRVARNTYVKKDDYDHHDRSHSIDTYINYMLRGVPEKALIDAYQRTAKDVGPAVAASMPAIPNVRRRTFMCEDGEDVEIDRYIAGESEMYYRTKQTFAKKRAVTLGINFVAGGYRDEEWFQQMVATATVFGRELVAQGYSVRLMGLRLPGYHLPGRSRGKTVIRGFTWPIIDFGERFDPISALTWGIPATVRYLGFGWCASIFPETGSGAGYEATLSDEILDLVGVDHLITAATHGDHSHHFLTRASKFISTLGR